MINNITKTFLAKTLFIVLEKLISINNFFGSVKTWVFDFQYQNSIDQLSNLEILIKIW